MHCSVQVVIYCLWCSSSFSAFTLFGRSSGLQQDIVVALISKDYRATFCEPAAYVDNVTLETGRYSI